MSMTRVIHRLHTLLPLRGIRLTLMGDGLRFLLLCLLPSPARAAENLFLRTQLALYQERHVKPRRATNTIRLAFMYLAPWFDWRQALALVQPATLIRWHRQGFWRFWRWKSRPGRPRLPAELQALIRQMSDEHPSWGQERIANALRRKLGLRISPSTVRKYVPKRLNGGPGRRVPSQRWRTLVRNHAQAIVACDFCVVVTATFRRLYVWVVMDHATRRMRYATATTHPTAPWTLHQLREAIPADHVYRFLIHDRDAMFSQELDQCVRHLGLKILTTPPHSPQANAICERLIGTLRRECLDCVIPLTAHHLRRLLHAWATHYHTGRPQMSLGPGIPQPPAALPAVLCERRHRWPKSSHVVARPILGGWHHDYRLEPQAA